jgi:hypothetical protein
VPGGQANVGLGRVVHQARMRARLVVASLRPWGTSWPSGCLPGWAQARSPQEQPSDQPRGRSTGTGLAAEARVTG